MSIDWQNFTPWASLLGGVVIGISAGAFALFNGRIAGISGILGGVIRALPFKGERADFAWRLAFLLGMMLPAWGLSLVGKMPEMVVDADTPTLITAGLLVGIGTRYASGCTSGHGVCGLSRLSKRGLVATAAFMLAGFITVFIVRHIVH